MSRIFLISGLGADYRLFRNLDLKEHEVTYVHWIDPDKEDTIASYAQKLINHYGIKDGDVVIGVSLGGLLTVEIAKQIKLDKAIIISSIKSSAEAPLYFTVFRRVPLYKLIPGKIITAFGFVMKPVFGHMEGEDSDLFRTMLQNSSPKFIEWAMHAVLHWQNDTVLNNVYHIVGNKDLVFNYRKIKDPIIVAGGTHIMVYDKAEQINQLLKEILAK